MSPYGCKKCGHPYALHSNGDTPCRATGCSAGPDGTPCQSFEPAQEEPCSAAS